MRLKNVTGLLLVSVCSLQMACRDSSQNAALSIKGKQIRIDFDRQLQSKIAANLSGHVDFGDYSPSEFITIQGQPVTDFSFKAHSEKKIKDQLGQGRTHLITGQAANLEKRLTVSLYDDWPNVAVYQVTYTNIGTNEVKVDGWTNHHYAVAAHKTADGQAPFWTFQPATYESRPDWVLPIKAGFKQDNFLGMNASDYGGGTPVADIWRPDAGIGIGHLELVPKLVSLPVSMQDSLAANIALQYEKAITLKPGESLHTFTTFVAVHQGDYFKTLCDYRGIMIRRGIKFNKNPDTVYEPQWCAWGYERKFTMDQVVNTLPKAKELGFQWAVLDDGWQTSEGDWYLTKDKFPRGDVDMIHFVNRIKAGGLKPQLWWCPLAVDPGTDLIKNHPEYLLLNPDGSKREISWWDSYYLCPAYAPVAEFTKGQVLKIMKEWGYQGLKIDGQHLNAAPPCYNPAHNHAYPEEACEKVPEFFKMIYETALSVYPDAVVEICPCGTSYSFHTMPYMNQSVASDPESSWQIRLKGKTLKALMGADAAYYGDHVELSDGHNDFASQVGVGAVIGTKFTWPIGAAEKKKYDLTPDREKEWRQWTKIYLENMLSKGTYRGSLYDIGYDRPEAHAIQKDTRMYYAFYAPEYKGAVELRGLGTGTYAIRDYARGQDYGEASGPAAKLTVEFSRYLLLVATPK